MFRVVTKYEFSDHTEFILGDVVATIQMCAFLPREHSKMSWTRSTSTWRPRRTRRMPNLWTNLNSESVLFLAGRAQQWVRRIGEPLEQRSPTLLNLRATSWELGHMKGNQAAALSWRDAFSQLVVSYMLSLTVLIYVKTIILLKSSKQLYTMTEQGWKKLNFRCSSRSCARFRTGQVFVGYLGTTLVTPVSVNIVTSGSNCCCFCVAGSSTSSLWFQTSPAEFSVSSSSPVILSACRPSSGNWTHCTDYARSAHQAETMKHDNHGRVWKDCHGIFCSLPW